MLAPSPVKLGLNESPSKKEGKTAPGGVDPLNIPASMKAPPKRKGKKAMAQSAAQAASLNESPSKKEGKRIILTGSIGFTL